MTKVYTMSPVYDGYYVSGSTKRPKRRFANVCKMFAAIDTVSFMQNDVPPLHTNLAAQAQRVLSDNTVSLADGINALLQPLISAFRAVSAQISGNGESYPSDSLPSFMMGGTLPMVLYPLIQLRW